MVRLHIDILEEWKFSNVFEFVNGFKLKTEFKNKFGCDIDDWDYQLADSDIIDELLEDMSGLYYSEYFGDGDGYFMIYKVNEVTYEGNERIVFL